MACWLVWSNECDQKKKRCTHNKNYCITDKIYIEYNELKGIQKQINSMCWNTITIEFFWNKHINIKSEIPVDELMCFKGDLVNGTHKPYVVKVTHENTSRIENVHVCYSFCRYHFHWIVMKWWLIWCSLTGTWVRMLWSSWFMAQFNGFCNMPCIHFDAIKSYYMLCVLTSYLNNFCVYLFLVWLLMDKLFGVWANNNEGKKK